ncbi:MAG: DUF2179 domain-containing protein [Bacilli bacterium]|nr:DUF2179 domain-containing protein [Bacilli bacterium]
MNVALLCIEIFFARILDVSIGVIRTIELVKDKTLKAVILAFFEILIWFLVAREALTSANLSIIVAIFYSLGYAIGTLVGSYLSKKFIKGSVGVQVISSKVNNNEINNIKKAGFGVSSLTLDGNDKKMLIIEVNKKRVDNLISLLKKYDNDAFITVSETKYVTNGYIR